MWYLSDNAKEENYIRYTCPRCGKIIIPCAFESWTDMMIVTHLEDDLCTVLANR